MALADDLELFITNKLLAYQGLEGTAGVASKIVNLVVNPALNPYPELRFTNARLKNVTYILAAGQSTGDVRPWVVPRLAALAFEGVFEACVAFWIAQRQPSDSTKLKDEVAAFVKWQTRAFASVVGKTP